MLKFNWVKTYIHDQWELYRYMRIIEADNPTVIIFDTETTGLHLRRDRPFYLTFSYVVGETGFAYAVDLTVVPFIHVANLLGLLYSLSSREWLVGHNIPFDLCMVKNYGKPVGRDTNLLDTMTLIRLGTDAVQVSKGGAPLKLKQFASRYLEKTAKFREDKVTACRKNIAHAYNQALSKQLPRGTIGKIKDILKTVPNDSGDLPEGIREIYDVWFESLPARIRENMTGNTVEQNDIPYDMIDRDILADYAIYDVIYTAEVFYMMYPIVLLRQPIELLKQECALIPALVEMLETGFLMNKQYLMDTRPILKAYIRERLADLRVIAKQELSANQNAKLLALLQETHPNLTSVNKESLEILSDELEEDDYETDELLILIQELRSLTKWYSTYFMKFYRTMQYDDYIYATINAAGTVTGRFTSNFQQFPKKPMKDKNKKIIFHPREMVCAPPDYYLLYIDYSQIELRIQALYTIMSGQPDLNLCRAYMPYLCHHYKTKEPYDFMDFQTMLRWDEKQPDGTPAWLYDEDDTPWTSTDLHGATLDNIYPGMDKESTEYESLRGSIGKRLNFACNYGAKPAKIMSMYHGITMIEATRRYNAYRNTFPGVIRYQRDCYNEIAINGYATNLYGRRYYGSNGHNVANAKVQGSGADLIKEKIIELYQHRKANKTLSRMQLTIHDENAFLLHKSEVDLIPIYKRIMEDVGGTYVPIVAEVEVSETTWARKTKGYQLNNGTLTFNAGPAGQNPAGTTQ